MKKPSIYLFCPAYNDEGNIEKVISSAVEVLDEVSSDYLITIFEDGSPDGTGEVADGLARKYDRVKVVHHPVNMGYGRTLQDGFTNPESSKYELVAYTDGDGQFDIAELKRILPLLEHNDVVIGYRINRVESWRRKVQSLVYNFLTRRICGLKFRDFNCSFKIFKREVLEHIEIEYPSIFIDAELVIKAHLAGYRIVEVGVAHYPRVSGQSSGAKWDLIWDTIKSMWKFWKAYRKGDLRYNPRLQRI